MVRHPTAVLTDAPGGVPPATDSAHDGELVAAVRAMARVARILERAAGDLGMAQYRVLSAVASGEPRAARVAERFELGRPTVSAAVEALAAGGLLDKSTSQDDQRAIDLVVSARGMAVLTAVEHQMGGVLADLCRRAGTPALPGALAALTDALDQRHTEHHPRTPARARTGTR